MDYEHLDLENIVDQDDFLEPNLDLDIEEQYSLNPELFEVENAIRECSELSVEEREDRYVAEAKHSEIQNAVYRQKGL